MKTKLILLFLLISTTIFGQNGVLTPSKETGKVPLKQYLEFIQNNKDVSYFEVTSEMFKMMSEADGVNDEFKENIRKLSSLIVLETNFDNHSNTFNEAFSNKIDIEDFTLLMKSSQSDQKVAFYKKENKNSEKEYLLVSIELIIYITGKIDINSLQEMDAIMNIADEVLDM